MRFYIATKLEREQDFRKLRDALTEAGYKLTYDWSRHGSVKNEGRARIREVAVSERQGVKDADFVVVLLPGGRGTHAELGMALAYGKRVFMHAADLSAWMGSDDRTCAFYHDPLVVPVTGKAEDIVTAVQRWAEEDRLGGWDAGVGPGVLGKDGLLDSEGGWEGV